MCKELIEIRCPKCKSITYSADNYCYNDDCKCSNTKHTRRDESTRLCDNCYTRQRRRRL